MIRYALIPLALIAAAPAPAAERVDVALSNFKFTPSTIRNTPSGVSPRPQWFSSPMTTPHSSAFFTHWPKASITHLKPSSSVYPGRRGSTPRFFINSSKCSCAFAKLL